MILLKLRPAAATSSKPWVELSRKQIMVFGMPVLLAELSNNRDCEVDLMGKVDIRIR